MYVTVLIFVIIFSVLMVGFIRISRRIAILGSRSSAAARLSAACASLDSIAGMPEDRRTGFLRGCAAAAEAFNRTENEYPDASSLGPDFADLLRGLRAGMAPDPECTALRERLAAHGASLNARQDADRRLLINPLALGLEGVKAVLATPIRIAGLAGWLDRVQVTGVEQSRLFHGMAVVGSVLGLLASAWSIIEQWSAYFANIDFLLRQ